MPGPLPNPNRRRRNAPTIPTTNLPVAGRKGRAPNCPYELADAGAAWWRWAWTLPQACAWSRGDLYAVARRARLEDDIAAMNFTEGFRELRDLLAGAEREAIDRVENALGVLKRLAVGKLSVEKEMRELDAKLGLTPESMAKLRWTIVDDEQPAAPTAPAPPPRRARPASSTARTHLRAVDPASADMGGAADHS